MKGDLRPLALLTRPKEGGGCCITKTLNAIIALCSSVSRMRAPKTKLAERASAQVTSGATHFSLMFGQEMRTKLPELSRETVDLNRQGVHERDWSSKLKGKAYAEEMRGAVSMKSIELGDEVLLRAEKSNKLLSNFCPRLFEVIRKTGVRLLSETTQDRRSPSRPQGTFPDGRGWKITSNATFVKRYHAQKSLTVNGSEKEPVCAGEEKVLSQESLSAKIDEKEDKRAHESNKETESHRPQESIRRSTCQDRRLPRFDDFRG